MAMCKNQRDNLTVMLLRNFSSPSEGFLRRINDDALLTALLNQSNRISPDRWQFLRLDNHVRFTMHRRRKVSTQKRSAVGSRNRNHQVSLASS